MPKVLLSSIDKREQAQVDAAEKAIKTGNAKVAVETCSAVLRRHPECTEVRRILRRAQKVATGKRPVPVSGLSKLLGALGSPNKAACAKDPQKSMLEAEKKLCANPYDINANKQLAFAAEAAGLWDVVALAYEDIVAVEAKTENYTLLVAAYLKDKDIESAVKAVDNALKKYPNNGDLQELARQVSVAQTMDNGQWDESKDYRSKLANTEKALELEKKSRVVSDADSAAEEVPKILAEIEKNPEDLQLYRNLARNYKIMGDLDNAVLAIQRARETTNGKVDATLEKQEHELTRENYERRIKEAEAVIAEDPSNEEYKTYLEELRKSFDEYTLQAIQTLVEKYPNDYNYRYEFGIKLLEAGNIEGAIRELQLAQRAPKNRHAAMLYLGRAFIASGKFDLAADQLSVAKEEIKIMSDIKKDIVYELATAYEKAGKQESAIAEYKAIYMADASYKDVSEKINAAYK